MSRFFIAVFLALLCAATVSAQSCPRLATANYVCTATRNSELLFRFEMDIRDRDIGIDATDDYDCGENVNGVYRIYVNNNLETILEATMNQLSSTSCFFTQFEEYRITSFLTGCRGFTGEYLGSNGAEVACQPGQWTTVFNPEDDDEGNLEDDDRYADDDDDDYIFRINTPAYYLSSEDPVVVVVDSTSDAVITAPLALLVIALVAML